MSAYQLHRPGSILFELCNFAAENSVNFINSAFKKKEAKKQKKNQSHRSKPTRRLTTALSVFHLFIRRFWVDFIK